ncbi:hypothetical protein JSE7799_03692 [Jannaschia seosinensis]|uniref:Aminoglycoside phosphotransferase domain-containing protein n=1 Tax=Jannaschia seosinensis TaxID=313367 RepID=A0A0M7BEY3_9RHOB|nr:phosphotransferase [Jannaschia seosinensis]CUH40951.1 hypothetical protein JSE7799_03692 [Jannaschia seosinensis]
MIAKHSRNVKGLLRAIIPDAALQAYKMARWRISARSSTRGVERWVSFKSFAAQQRTRGAQEYGKFLSKADPTLQLPKLGAPHFVGEGFGDYNLNLYRAGELAGKPVFEKIYFSGSDSLRKTEWFHDKVLPLVGAEIRTPPILLKVRGNCLTALYFPLLELSEPISADAILPVAIALQDTTRELSWTGPDPIIHEFWRDHFYLRHRNELLSIISQNGREQSDIFKAENFLQRGEVPRKFSHGDLSPENVRTCGMLIDFDHCGYYPAGYDSGAALRCSQTPASVAELEVLVEEELAPNCRSTQLSILFFMAVFSSMGAAKKTHGQPDENFVLHLWDRILARLQKVET